jgi:potassium efflux system protein
MRPVTCALCLIAFLAQFLPANPAYPADTAAMVTSETLNARLKEVEVATSLDEQTRGALAETLNNALGNLEAERANKATMESYIQAVKTAPQQAREIRAELEKDIQEPREITVSATDDTPFEEIEGELLQEKANRAAVETRLADLESRLESAKARPAAVQQQLAAAKRQREDLDSELKLPVPAEELPWVTEARRWSQTTRIAALRSEIAMFDQELLSMPMRLELLEAQRDQTQHTVERIAKRVSLLEVMASRQGRAEAEQAETEARAAVYDAAGKHPLIQELAEQNAALTGEISALAADLKKTSASDEAITREARRIEGNFRAVREKVEVAGLTQVLGEVLRQQQRQVLPDQRELGKTLRQLEQLNARTTLRQIQYAAEYRRLRNIDEYTEEQTAALEPAEAEQVSNDIAELAIARRLLLEKANSLAKSYSRSLTELETGNRRLLKITVDFDNFLAEKLLWIRSAPRPNLTMLQAIPAQFAGLLAPERWLDVFRMLAAWMKHSSVSVLLLGLIGILLWKVRRIKALLREMGNHVGKPSVDEFSFTLKALGLTLLLAVPLPLLLAVTGWGLRLATEATPFSAAVSTALLHVALTFLYLQFFSILCIQGGVAEKHFGWRDPIPRQLRRGFRRLMAVFLPAVFVLLVLLNDEQQVLLAGLERLLLIVALVAVAVFFYRLSRLLVEHSIGAMIRLRYLWLTLTVATPLLLAALAVAGYIYTAGSLGGSLLKTLWFVFGLVVLHQIVARWLLLTQRRLALQAIRERLRSAGEEKEPVDSEMEGMPAPTDEPEIDLIDMSEESRKLLNTLLVIIGIVGFWLIWSDVLPAFNVLDEIVLWHHTAVVAGEETLAPVTLADIGLGILIAIGTYVAMKRFPSLLEIVLLQRVSMPPGARYTVTTVTTYLIVGIGLLAFFNVIGADWSKLQWLFAALGVGIGFGLQEIVANFISGLIILFERPIRVGDVVTIGDTNGVVTRIQIRATTIRTWDRQELLVPNKEFITGRLLNWSLSDQTTRIKVPVGVAYGSDVQLAMSLMDEAARENENVLAEPSPSIIFDAFGDNALNLVLRCFVGTQDIRLTTITQLHEAINRKFNDAGICIAFPQRDVHLDTTRPLDVRIRRDDGAGDVTA